MFNKNKIFMLSICVIIIAVSVASFNGVSKSISQSNSAYLSELNNMKEAKFIACIYNENISIDAPSKCRVDAEIEHERQDKIFDLTGHNGTLISLPSSVEHLYNDCLVKIANNKCKNPFVSSVSEMNKTANFSGWFDRKLSRIKFYFSNHYSKTLTDCLLFIFLSSLTLWLLMYKANNYIKWLKV